MSILPKWSLAISLFTALAAAPAIAAPPAHDLSAQARDGQIFLTWTEDDTPAGTTFNVYASDQPIAKTSASKLVAHHVERHSARDWWEDRTSFTKDAKATAPVGFRIRPGEPCLDPAGGLFVYTVPKDGTSPFFFAVTATDATGHEDSTIEAGRNALAKGVAGAPTSLKPIWQRDTPMPDLSAGAGKPLWLELHAKGGVVANMEFLAFGDETMGWRAGLPFKFSVRIQSDGIYVRPTDRAWINRPHDEAADGGTPAIWTFWYGYNSKIYDRSLMPTGIPTNYTERRNLWLLDWVRENYHPDPNRWYCYGSSMGGCGTISFGLRHPELFTALHAHVPIVAYTYLGRGSAHRFEPSCWVGALPSDLKNNNGQPFLDHLDGRKYVLEAKADLPPLSMVNGRQDNSIPWQNNPPFYRALESTRRAFAVYWDNGNHATCGKDAPEDVKQWKQRLLRYRRDECYPSFANCSANRKLGDGKPEDGDPIGWMNRGMDWKELEDSPDHLSASIVDTQPEVQYPVQVDVTFHRPQRFKLRPNEAVSVAIGDSAPVTISADADGVLTVPAVAITSPAGTRLTIRRQTGR